MKGAGTVLFALIGFELLVTTKLSDLAPAISWVTGAVAKWMDPDVPLISAAVGSGGASTTSGGSSPASTASILGAGLGAEWQTSGIP